MDEKYQLISDITRILINTDRMDILRFIHRLVTKIAEREHITDPTTD